MSELEREKRQVEDALTKAFLKCQKFKQEHPELKNGVYTNLPGSWLNGYREGDLSFDETVKRITDIQADRDSWKAKAEAYEATLKLYANEKLWAEYPKSFATVVFKGSKGLGFMPARDALESASHPPQGEKQCDHDMGYDPNLTTARHDYVCVKCGFVDKYALTPPAR